METLLSLFYPGAGFGNKWERELETKPTDNPAKIDIGNISFTFPKYLKNRIKYLSMPAFFI